MQINDGVKHLLMAMAASAVMGAAAVAQAGILIPTGFAKGSETFTLSIGGTVSAGGFKGTWNGSPIQFWCAELGQSFSFNPNPGYTYTASVPNDATFTAIGQLFHEAYAMALVDTDHSAAFQLALWEILFNGDLSSLNLATGAFKVTDDHGNHNAVAIAQTWLADLGNFTDNYTITKLSNETRQDFMTAPEPGPLALIGVALAAMLVGGRRRGNPDSRG